MKRRYIAPIVCVLGVLLMGADGDGCNSHDTRAASGVSRVSVAVKRGADGLTIEQKNIADRLGMDNKPGSIKHLYIISAYSGDVLVYSTVRGKVTSSGKRLTPKTVNTGGVNGFWFEIGGNRYETGEVLQDDGSYGDSIEYLYWWDSKGIYHQHYPAGGQIIHVSDQPLAVRKVILNMETAEQ